MEKLELTVTCASGVETACKKEIGKICAIEPPLSLNGAMSFTGDALTVARLNMFLRTADRVYIKLAVFKATTFDQLFESVKSISFERFISKNGKITVNGKSRKSTLYALSASQSIIKKAIVERLCNYYGLLKLPETEERYDIEFVIFEDTVTLLLNTTGEGLHKRGYRDLVWKAPIRENLASAMLFYSRFDYNKPLADIFCGSGTILIEGAMMSLNIAPGKLRRFDYQNWNWFDKTLYFKAKEEALSKELDKKIDVFGSDIDKKAISLAKHHIENAGLKDKIKLKCLSVKEFFTAEKCGTIVTNAPYGERSLDKDSVQTAYKDLRYAYDRLDGWSLHLITSFPEFERVFGKRADKNRKLYNADKECRFYSYYAKNTLEEV